MVTNVTLLVAELEAARIEAMAAEDRWDQKAATVIWGRVDQLESTLLYVLKPCTPQERARLFAQAAHYHKDACTRAEIRALRLTRRAVRELNRGQVNIATIAALRDVVRTTAEWRCDYVPAFLRRALDGVAGPRLVIGAQA